MNIDFERIDAIEAEKAAIKIKRTDEFHSKAHELSKFIAGLPLSQPENDKLIALVVRQIEAGEQGAFQQGFRMGSDILREAEEERRKKNNKDKAGIKEQTAPGVLAGKIQAPEPPTPLL